MHRRAVFSADVGLMEARTSSVVEANAGLTEADAPMASASNEASLVIIFFILCHVAKKSNG